MPQWVRFSIVMLAISVGSGCAVTRSEMDLAEVPVENPAEGPEVTFVRLVDARDFELEPGDPSTPSLKNGEIENASITSRALARKRNGYGQALGDILLPEGSTVTGVVENRLARSFANRGYRVVEEGQRGYTEAVPLEVSVERFWGWFTPGFFTIDLQFETLVRVTGPLAGLRHGKTFQGASKESFAAAMDDNWRRVLNAALDNLEADIQATLPAPE
ncbi:MAG: hypothetical protein JXJ30_10780 [Halothiobacillaceae bacterium]|nr:hypothetical protein [Halothiobacillaceae bacterium]HER34485.1 hypothetical protein [Halothiobacillaceae bacterium]